MVDRTTSEAPPKTDDAWRRNAGSFGVNLRRFPAPGWRLGALLFIARPTGPAVDPIRPRFHKTADT